MAFNNLIEKSIWELLLTYLINLFPLLTYKNIVQRMAAPVHCVAIEFVDYN